MYLQPLTAELLRARPDLEHPIVTLSDAIRMGVRVRSDYVARVEDDYGLVLCMLHFEIIAPARQVRLFAPTVMRPDRPGSAVRALTREVFRFCAQQHGCVRFCWANTDHRQGKTRTLVELWLGREWRYGDQNEFAWNATLERLEFPPDALPPLFYERWDGAGARKIVNVTPHTLRYAHTHWIPYERRAQQMYERAAWFVDHERVPLAGDLGSTERLLYDLLVDAQRRTDMKLPPDRLAQALDNTYSTGIADLVVSAIKATDMLSAPRFLAFTTVLDGDDRTLDAAIYFYAQGPTLRMRFVTRFMHGLVKRVKRDVRELPSVDALFRMVMRFNKEELGCTTLEIAHATWGSTKMLERNQTDEARRRGLLELRPQDEENEYGVDAFRIERRLCDGPRCLGRPATQCWAHDERYAFCGAQCAHSVFINACKKSVQ